jgi:hypothetical protein
VLLLDGMESVQWLREVACRINSSSLLRGAPLGLC